MKPFILAAAFVFSVMPAHAVTCAKPGTVGVFNTSGGYAFVVSRTYGDAMFMIPGAGFRKDPGAPRGSTQFLIDGVHYQYLTVPKAPFVSAAAVSDDAAILARHARREHKFAVDAGSPFTAFDDLGNRDKPAEQGHPAMVFKLWTLKDPKKPGGASQYMLTTVAGTEVALLSAILMSGEQEQRVMDVMTRFATSYQFLQSADQCPLPGSPKTN